MTEDDEVLAMALEEESQALTVTDKTLSGLSKLIIALHDKEIELENLEAQVARKKQEIRVLEESQIPELMKDMKLKEWIFDDGTKVTLKSDFAISIPAEKRDAAADWAEQHGHEGIVKALIKVAFGKGDYEEAQKLYRRIRKSTNLGEVTIERSIHPQTLKAWAKELRANSLLPLEERIPEHLFTIFEYSKVTIKVPRKREKAPKGS